MHTFLTYFLLTFHECCIHFSRFTTLSRIKIKVFTCMRFTLALKCLLEKVL